MKTPEAQSRIQHLKDELNAWNQAYFNDNRTLYPEPVRDQLKKELIALEHKHPDLITPDSPTQRVGVALNGKLPKITHKSRRYSLGDVFDAEELRDFDTRVKRFLKVDHVEYSCELKLDGINITLWYENGKLVKAVTRGDGYEGEDVTHTIKTCKNVPLILPQDLTIEVSGECFIAHKDFEDINKNLTERFANSRNLTAGSVRQLDPRRASERNMRLFLYESYSDIDVANQAELFQFFDKLNLPHEKEFEVFSDIEQVIKFCQKWSDKKTRENLWYDIDGIVVKVHDFGYRRRLGYTAKTAKYAVAWKFPAEEKYTTLLDVHFQVGRTGAVTPVGILDPILISGSTVSKASLHNPEEMKRKGIQIGDHVIVRKAGEIIPEIIGALENLRNGNEKEIVFPTNCPECGHPLNNDEIVTRCLNPDCPAKHRESLIYFAKALNIDGLGEKTIHALLDLELIHTPADFWKLDHHDLAMIPGFKHRKVYNLLDALDAKKSLELADIITGLGIRNIGKENAKLIAEFLRDRWNEFDFDAFSTIQKELTHEDLLNRDGIGPTVAKSFFDYLQQDKTKKLWSELHEHKISIHWPPKREDDLPYSGTKFVITGSFESVSRDELKKIITQNGGKVLSSISQNTDILLAGANAGSKLKKGKELQIEIWDEATACEKLNIQKHEAPQTSLF